MSKKGKIKDYIFPVSIGILSGSWSYVMLCMKTPKDVLLLSDSLQPMMFGYATTMAGLAIACYTLFETLNNDTVVRIRSMKVYGRYKKYIYSAIRLMSLLAVMCLCSFIGLDLLTFLVVRRVLLALEVFLTVMTLCMILKWMKSLVVDMTGGRTDKQ